MDKRYTSLLDYYAIYKGREFEFTDSGTGKYLLASYDIRDKELGFSLTRHSTDRYVKYITLRALDFVFKRKAVVIYKGDEFWASVIEGDQIMIRSYDSEMYEKYNMEIWDRDDYFLYVNAKDVDEIRIEWIPQPQYMTNVPFWRR